MILIYSKSCLDDYYYQFNCNDPSLCKFRTEWLDIANKDEKYYTYYQVNYHHWKWKRCKSYSKQGIKECFSYKHRQKIFGLLMGIIIEEAIVKRKERFLFAHLFLLGLLSFMFILLKTVTVSAVRIISSG